MTLTLGDVFAICVGASALVVCVLIALDVLDARKDRKRGGR